MLGTAVPEPGSIDQIRKDISICSAGISRTHGLIRINPIPFDNYPKRWSVNKVQLAKSKDSRIESYKIANDDPFKVANTEFELIKKQLPTGQRQDLLAPHFETSINAANKKRLSLALINFSDFTLYFKENDKYSPHLSLFGGAKTNERFKYHPRLKFKDQEGRPHDLRIRSWDAFEWIRKCDVNPEFKKRKYSYNDLYYTLHLDKPRVLFIGNMIAYRNSWLIISVLAK